MVDIKDKLSILLKEMELSSELLFNGSLVINNKNRGRQKSGIYEIKLIEQNNAFLIPEIVMPILSAKDLIDMPGNNYAFAETNPISLGVLNFCKVFKNSDAKDFEEYGREVLLEGLKSCAFSMDSRADPFGIYNFMRENEVFRDDLGFTNLKQTGEFFRTYGRLPYPNESLQSPKSLCLFKEKINVPIGVYFKIGEKQATLLKGKENHKNVDSIIVVYNHERESYVHIDAQNFLSFGCHAQNWISNISIKDVRRCIESGLPEDFLTMISRLDPEGFSGSRIKLFADVFNKEFSRFKNINKFVDIKGVEALKMEKKSSPDKYYAKGFIPFLLSTGRFPTLKEFKKFYEKNMEPER